ncbi:MAG TPA: EAL domain-containing protein [Feifaniaceae bacterium]|nr:EAL domain-containing protein [Feifaniaceae bacterium]
MLDEKMHTRLFDYLGLLYLSGGCLYFLAHCFGGRAAAFEALPFSGLLLLFGLVIFVSSRLRLRGNTKEYVALAAICVSIPVITLRFSADGAETIWPFPFLFLFAAMLYEKKTALICVTFSALVSQIALVLFTPAPYVGNQPGRYMVRIYLFLLGFLIALFINGVYVSRMKQSRSQIRLQKLFFELSSELVSSSLFNIREKIEHTLFRLGMFFQVEQVYLLLALGNGSMINSVLQWGRDGVPSIEPNFLGMDMDEAAKVHAAMEKEHTIAMFPVSVNQISFGILAMPCTDQSVCTEENRAAMRIIANMLGDALSKAESERAINEMAYYDHLTNLPNRISFNSRVEQAIQMVSRRGRQFAVMFLDLDSFKNVNDTMGHESGDLLLKLISRQLISSLRPKDTVSRFGGDEFLVLINDLTTLSDLPLIADRIMNLFRVPFLLDGQEFNITASAGISVYPMDGGTADALVKNADIAMYQAKAKGKNQYVICSPSLKQEVTDRLNLTNNLYRALEREELMLYYQPQIDIKGGAIIGLEALLRWKHPELGMVPPYSFIPLAEHTGLINPIGEWVLRTACAQSVLWQQKNLPPVRMAVNISAIQFTNPTFAPQVARVLQQTGLNPACLELELTESAALQNVEHTIHVLSGLKELGVSISIDDFGTEYSSLSRLKLLPIDRIKMDMQFVHSIGGTSKDQAMTKIIISLAKNLGLKVIAEGVETKQQLDFLTQRMCDEVQGYYYFHPMPPEEVEAVLRERGAVSPLSDIGTA